MDVTGRGVIGLWKARYTLPGCTSCAGGVLGAVLMPYLQRSKLRGSSFTELSSGADKDLCYALVRVAVCVIVYESELSSGAVVQQAASFPSPLYPPYEKDSCGFCQIRYFTYLLLQERVGGQHFLSLVWL